MKGLRDKECSDGSLVGHKKFGVSFPFFFIHPVLLFKTNILLLLICLIVQERDCILHEMQLFVYLLYAFWSGGCRIVPGRVKG